MKKTNYILILFIIILSTFAVADMDLELNATTPDNMDADINLYSGNNMNVNVNVETNGQINLTENYIQNTFVDKVEYYEGGGTDKFKVLRIIADRIAVFLGLKKDDNPAPDEQYFQTIIEMFGNTVISKTYNEYIYKLELELETQKRINAMYQKDIDNLKNITGLSLTSHSAECTAYIQTMAEHGIDGVTCNDRGVLLDWKTANNLAVHVN